MDLVLPSWIPGSYNIQNFVRGLRSVRAYDRGRSRPLPVARVDKARWRVTTEGESHVEVEYTVYGYQMVTEAFDVTPEHLFINPAASFLFVDGRQSEPAEVTVHVPRDWKVFTELSEVAAHPPRFRARDYDELVDSPIDCGRPLAVESSARGIPHRVVLCGAGGNFEVHRLDEDLRRIAETTMEFFGASPLQRYTWFLHLHEVGDGALEHRACVSVVHPRTGFRPPSKYRRFLLTAAHEYFHVYNVKRIRPAVLGPFDYTREAYTRLLWAMEGTTDYYAHLILRRSNLLSPAKVLEMFADLARRLSTTPGRFVTDLETASLAAWVDLYQPYEESLNQSVSYYLKGALVSLALDLDLRHRSENRTSLDVVWRHLWTEYGARGRGIGEDDLQGIMEAASGLPLGDFFDRYVRGTAELDLNEFTRYAGLELRAKEKPTGADDDPPAGWLGIEYGEAEPFVKVNRVVDGGPGRRGGLSPGDELVAVDGVRLRPKEFTATLARFPAGSEVRLTVFRRGLLTDLTVTTGTPPPETLEFRPVEAPSDLAKTIYASWFSAPWEPRKPPGGTP